MTFAFSVHWARRLAALAIMLAVLGYSPPSPAQEQAQELGFLLLEVRLGQTVLSSAIPAYDVGEHTLLPLGTLSSLLTIAIQTQPEQGTASGFVISEDRGFSLNLNEAKVTREGITESFDPALVMAEPDDLYAAKSLLEKWLPLELEIDRSRLLLQVHALEALPLQERLRRTRLGERIGMGGYEDPDYPEYELPYRLLSMPVIDQTFATEVRRDDQSTRTDARYTAFLTGDLLGMESSLYFSAGQQDPSPEVRATLGRHDPDAGLLGPLHARSYRFGSLSSPSVDNITRGATGEGVMLSNRPLTQPTSFDRQTFEGDLPPGWDVELYYNDALVGFQRAGPDGRYRFEDQPLSYGRNDFRLVFNGPLGQTRVEQYSFSLAQSMVRPGEFQYSLAQHRDEDGQARSVAQFDLGIARYLSATAGFIRAPVDGETEQQYTNFGLRTFWRSFSLNGDFIQAEGGGSLAEVGLQTRIAGIAVDASRIRLNDFQSDIFSSFSDPIKTRDEIRLSGSIPVGARSRLPVTVEARRDERKSGDSNTDVSARVSAYAYRTAITNTLRWRAFGDEEYASGMLQLSRRVRDMSLRSQINYTLGSESELSALALSADKYLTEGYRMTLGVAHTFTEPQTLYTAGFTKSLGRYGLGVSASYADTGEVAVGAQLFVAMGRDPRRSDWLFDARPMANSGAASIRMFLDENNNGVMDDYEAPIEGVGFTVDGGRRQARTDASGIAHIGHLPVKQHVDIGVDTSTLINPQWEPQLEGVSLVPRPGGVAELEFPVRLTTEIDGTVYLLENGTARGIGDLKLELLNGRHEIVGEATSAWDGFYIVPDVASGDYWLRISPQQLQRLDLVDTGIRKISVSGDGDFISGIDFTVMPATRAPAPPSAAPRDGADAEPAGRSGFRTGSWVWEQPSANFTIQLMAASSETLVQQYIARHNLRQRTAYVRAEFHGAPWYQVIHGSYDSLAEAQAALERLPSALTRASPWLRQFRDIQAMLEKPAPLALW